MDQGFTGYPTACGMLSYWQAVAQDSAASQEEGSIARIVNTLRQSILSRTAQTLMWDNAELLVVPGDHELVATVREIKQWPGRDPAVSVPRKRLCGSA
jgi:hypothetical protein